MIIFERNCKLKKLFCKSLLFLVLLGTILAPLTSVFVYKIDHRGKLIDGLYTANDNYDVVLMGSSHMNGGIDPNVLWKQYGITSYNYATGGQPIDVTYYLLKEVLKNHTPSVVVVDLYYLGLKDSYGETGFVSNVLDNMQFSENKLDAIIHCTSPKEWLSYLLPVLKYHARWSDLSSTDLNYDSSSVYYEKGFQAGTNKYGKADSTLAYTDKKEEIPQKTVEYLQKIIELSKQYGFQLVFTNMPSDYTESNESQDWVDDCEAMFNTVADFCEKEQIPFLDYCDKMDEIGLDFANDMNNDGHLNIWGACKVSTDFGSYLKQNFSLTDHRSDSSYAQWNEDYSHSQAASLI